MGAHRADHATPTGVGVRATATAAAVVALTGAGAGIASAHEGSQDGSHRGSSDGRGWSDGSFGTDYQDDHGGCDGLVDRVTGESLSSAGLSRDDASGTCADPSSLGGLDPSGSDDGGPFGWSSTSGPSGTGSADRPESSGQSSPGQQTGQAPPAAQSGQVRPAAQSQPAGQNPVDTPPPPGQTRLIKLPSAH